MNSISIKELKAKLQSYLDWVSRGEKFVITDRGKEVALLAPVPSDGHIIRSLIGAKKAKWNGRKPAGIKCIRIMGKSLSRTVLKERR